MVISSSIATLLMQPTAVPLAGCWLLLPLLVLLVVIGLAVIEGVPRLMNFSADDFEYLGFEIIGAKKCKGTAFALRCFKGHFGVTPQRIAAIVFEQLFPVCILAPKTGAPALVPSFPQKLQHRRDPCDCCWNLREDIPKVGLVLQ
jgi:hypothetical protein